MKDEALVALSLVLAGLSTYFQGSSGKLSFILLLAALLSLFTGIHLINSSKPSKRSGDAHLLLGLLLPILLFLNYGNPLYLVGGAFMAAAMFWKSEKAILLIIPAGIIMGWLAFRESSYVARLVGAFLLAVSFVVGTASLYFWLRDIVRIS